MLLNVAVKSISSYSTASRAGAESQSIGQDLVMGRLLDIMVGETYSKYLVASYIADLLVSI